MSNQSNNTKFILRYPGNCVTFNMMQVSRVKKDGKSISEQWENEDDDNFLIIRLMENKSLPLLVAHHGIYEIVKAPLFVPVVKACNDPTTVTVFLRDHANRGISHCIRR